MSAPSTLPHTHEIVSGDRVVFSGPQQACLDYFDSVGGHAFGWRVQRSAALEQAIEKGERRRFTLQRHSAFGGL